jgi:hypothetical protein
MTVDDDYSDESSIDAPPPPPPPAEIVIGGNDLDAEPQETAAVQTEDEKYHEQLKIFKDMAEFRDLPGVFKDDHYFHSDSKENEHDDERGVAVPPTMKVNRTGTREWRMENSTLYAGITTVAMLMIIIILGVGIGMGGFDNDSSSTNSSIPGTNSSAQGIPGYETERASRLHEYLYTVTSNDINTFSDPISPESQALAWLQDSDPAELDPINFDDHLRINQRFALLTLWFQSDFDWYDQSNWLTEDECTWKGITCITVTPGLRRQLQEMGDGQSLKEGDNLIALVNLGRNNLQGNIPPDFALLKYLKTLNLSWNQIQGSIPSTIATMEYVEELFLDHNNLTGQLLTTFFEMSDLATLDVASNQLDGTIPLSLWEATGMKVIRLDNNGFEGNLPESIGNLLDLGKYRTMIGLHSRHTMFAFLKHDFSSIVQLHFLRVGTACSAKSLAPLLF